MAFTSNTVKPIQPLRTLYGGTATIPVFKFPVVTTSLAIYEGNAFHMPATAVGQVEECDGTAGQGVPGTGIVPGIVTNGGGGLVGFAIGASTGAPPFPTAAGAASGGLLFTTPSSVTANDPIPENEKVLLALALPGVVFKGHLCTSSTGVDADYSSTDRNDLLKTYGLSVEVVLATNRCFVDVSVTSGGSLVKPVDWAYPQNVPVARGTTGSQADPWRLQSTGKTNPAIEFVVVQSYWQPFELET